MKRCNRNWTLLVVLVVGSFRPALSMIQNCKLYNKECTIVTNCSTAMTALKARNVLLLRSMFCGFDVRLPKVCCPVDESIVFHNDTETATSRITTTSTTINPTIIMPITKSPTVVVEENTIEESTHTYNGLPTNKICGISGSGSDRIIGGTITGIDEFPWLARIATNKNGMRRFTCGGSLITPQFVVTAAHCVLNHILEGVRLGEWDSETEKDCTDDYCSDPPLDIKVTKVITHPGYDHKLHNNDIALLRLAHPVNYTDFIRPVCLPVTREVANQDYIPGTIFTTAGWGYTELGTVSIIKQKVDLDTVPIEVCKTKLPHVNKMNSSKILCAGGKIGKDTCNGDSGGPLVKEITVKFKTNWYLFGITSFGAMRCGVTDTPSVYTRVTSYMDWIIKNVNT